MVLFPGTAIQQGPQSQEAHTSQLSMSTIVTLSVVIVMLTSLQAWTRFGSCARYWSTRTLCDKHKQRGSVYNGNADIICTRGIVCLTRSSKPFSTKRHCSQTQASVYLRQLLDCNRRVTTLKTETKNLTFYTKLQAICQFTFINPTFL